MMRYYDTNIGRYITSDPIGLLYGGINTYSYTGSNPVNKIDPMGLYYSGLPVGPDGFRIPGAIFKDSFGNTTREIQDAYIELKADVEGVSGCIRCAGPCLLPILAADALIEDINSKLEKKGKERAFSAAALNLTGRVVMTARIISGAGTFLAVATCSFECKDVCVSCNN
ncbi:MAG: RHS repeat-associated core domain-containing protein [Proteobacteria bacterium]|nr:RHS repeat-associated core domain-containing protein [Pseudomonadota bacterium]NOG60904.1 RHS repeat-associated core domain-containing protein [Pseudomonadota bacterium]